MLYHSRLRLGILTEQKHRNPKRKSIRVAINKPPKILFYPNPYIRIPAHETAGSVILQNGMDFSQPVTSLSVL